MKRFISILLLAIMVAVLPAKAYASDTVKVLPKLNYINVEGYERKVYCYNINGNNYFRLRDLGEILMFSMSEFNITWNGSTNTIEINTGEDYTGCTSDDINIDYNKSIKAVPCKSKIMVNGEYKKLKAYTINNSNYFKLRDLGEVIGFDVDWDITNKQIVINSKLPDNAKRLVTNTYVEANFEESFFLGDSDPIYDYIQDNKNGTYNTIDVNKGDAVIKINTYDKNNKLLKEKTLQLGQSIFGGFYSGEKYNYIVFGFEYMGDDPSNAMYKIVKYDKDFNKIDSVSILNKDCLSRCPFFLGSVRMSEKNGKLVVHTSRLTNETDGKRQHLQQTIIIDTDSMKVINDVGVNQKNIVYGSLNQFVQFDGDNIVLVDHGCENPRSIVLHKGNGTNYEKVDLFKIPGDAGAMRTGVSVGGFEVSSSNYIVALNTVNHKKVTKYTYFELEGIVREQRDIVLCVSPKDNLDPNKVKQITIAKYDDTDKIGTVPKLVKITNDKFVIMWQEWSTDYDYNYQKSCFKYAYIDGDGNILGEIQKKDGFVVSKCQPIVMNNNITWFTNLDDNKILYNIPIK